MRINRSGRVAFFAAITGLVVVAATGNQSVTKAVNDHIGGGSKSVSDHFLSALLTFSWRFTPQSGTPAQHYWGAQFGGIGLFLVLILLFVLILDRRWAGLGQVFLGTWLAVLAATLAGVIFKAVLYPFVYGSGDRLLVGLFVAPNGENIVYGVGCGFVVAIVATLITAATRQEVPAEVAGVPGEDETLVPHPDSGYGPIEQPPPFPAPDAPTQQLGTPPPGYPPPGPMPAPMPAPVPTPMPTTPLSPYTGAPLPPAGAAAAGAAAGAAGGPHRPAYTGPGYGPVPPAAQEEDVAAGATTQAAVPPGAERAPAPAEAPTVEAPTAEAPTAVAPTVEAPTAEAPTAEAPTAEAPVQAAPVEEAPVEAAPVEEAPTAEAPTAEAPTRELPVHEAEGAAQQGTSPQEPREQEPSPADPPRPEQPPAG